MYIRPNENLQRLVKAFGQVIAFVSVACGLLIGCAFTHEFYLVGRGSGITGGSTVPANGRHGGPITVTLGGKVFQGRWIYVQGGASLGLGAASAFSGTQSATASGMFIGLPTGGNGTIIAAASDKSTLKCSFYFSEWNLKGTGVCQDSGGETYDLQIS